MARATWVCQHLVGAEGVVWISGPPTADDSWPHAWCEACHRALVAEGEWNERSEAAADLRVTVICHHCYEEFKGGCSPRIV